MSPRLEEELATLTCPLCGHQQEEEIPPDSCVPFYKCNGCRDIILAKKSCGVFCDYGDRPCPVGHKEME